MNAELTYVRGLPAASYEAAASLYDRAFGDKIARAVSNQAARVELIRRSFDGQHAISVFCGSRLVGLAGYHTSAGSLTSQITAGSVLKQLGWWRGLKAIVVLALLDRQPAEGELLMDGIVVDPRYRGRGVGTELLRRTVALAWEKGFNSVRLDVIDSNQRAKSLYERFGFQASTHERFPFLERILGFAGATTMVFRRSAT